MFVEFLFFFKKCIICYLLGHNDAALARRLWQFVSRKENTFYYSFAVTKLEIRKDHSRFGDVQQQRGASSSNRSICARVKQFNVF